MYGWAQWCLAVSTALGKWRCEDGEFEVSRGCVPGLYSKFQTGLVYVVRPGLKQKQNKTKCKRTGIRKRKGYDMIVVPKDGHQGVSTAQETLVP